MFDYSNIISERKLEEEDIIGYPYKDLSIIKHLPEFSFVHKGDWVIRLGLNWTEEYKYDFYADKTGYVRYEIEGGSAQKKIGTPLFYIAENNDMCPTNWDVSQIRIEKKIIDGKYYYSLMGVPTEPILDLGKVMVRMVVTNDDPKWTIEISVRGISKKIEEPFNVKLKNGSSISRSQIILYTYQWDDEGDGKHFCVRNFAIGYPKRTQIRQDVQPTPTTTNAEEACFVYIMRNNDNGAYKIGISNNPKYREHTLQSQEPNVTCIFQLEFESRERARSVESDMHLKWAEFHLRGEWFAIPHERVNEVMKDIIKYK